METITSVSPKYSIKQIFQDHWQRFLQNSITPIVDYYIIENVNKMLDCRDPQKLGYHKFACPNHPDCCTVVPHSCKSRFCNTCAKVLTDLWISKVTSHLPNTSYFHIVFTIPDSLRELFDKNRFLFNCLFTAASQTMLSWAKERYFLPAMICIVHTFGDDLKFNCHIHMLITAGGLSLKNQNEWIHYDFIPYKMVQKRWKVLLLNHLKSAIKKYLKSHPDDKTQISLFSNPGVLNAFFVPLYKIDWYAHVGIELNSPLQTVGYIGRYAKRPPISQARILSYDGEKVQISYRERKNSSPILWTMPAEKFISLLIRHILPKNFKVIRNYGLISNKVINKYREILSIIHKDAKQVVIKFHNWAQRQTKFKGRNPLLCPICNREMILVESAYFSQKAGCLRIQTHL